MSGDNTKLQPPNGAEWFRVVAVVSPDPGTEPPSEAKLQAAIGEAFGMWSMTWSVRIEAYTPGEPSNWTNVNAARNVMREAAQLLRGYEKLHMGNWETVRQRKHADPGGSYDAMLDSALAKARCNGDMAAKLEAQLPEYRFAVTATAATGRGPWTADEVAVEMGPDAPLHAHPVDVLQRVGGSLLSPEREAELRALCDEPVMAPGQLDQTMTPRQVVATASMLGNLRTEGVYALRHPPGEPDMRLWDGRTHQWTMGYAIADSVQIGPDEHLVTVQLGDVRNDTGGRARPSYADASHDSGELPKRCAQLEPTHDGLFPGDRGYVASKCVSCGEPGPADCGKCPL